MLIWSWRGLSTKRQVCRINTVKANTDKTTNGWMNTHYQIYGNNMSTLRVYANYILWPYKGIMTIFGHTYLMNMPLYGHVFLISICKLDVICINSESRHVIVTRDLHFICMQSGTVESVLEFVTHWRPAGLSFVNTLNILNSFHSLMWKQLSVQKGSQLEIPCCPYSHCSMLRICMTLQLSYHSWYQVTRNLSKIILCYRTYTARNF